MPQTSSENEKRTRDILERAGYPTHFGTDGPALKYLELRQFRITNGGVIQPPERKLTRDEMRVIDYLIYEWDYGHIV